jgi:hypothetical protein
MSTVSEDNQAANALAAIDPPHMTPCSKHVATSYHWLCSLLLDALLEGCCSAL